MQTRLIQKTNIKYNYGSYNVIKKDQQWIRLSQGCPHNCPYCYEPQEYEIYTIPEIKCNKVGIIDMNLLCKPESLDILRKLPIGNNGSTIQYDFVCGIDYRFLTKEIAQELKNHNVKRVRIAWDWFYKDQIRIRDALKILYSVGYKSKDIMIFMICNWDISYDECLKKLDVCKVWNVLVADCYYDNQIKIHKKFIPIKWTTEQAYDFRDRVRTHNQLVNFGIDPEIKPCPFHGPCNLTLA